MSETTINDEQQFCLRWNNFQANITSQFEALRDDEDFTDVTIACDGKRLQAHRVVLSACSPFFKELFKTNPCSHPIIFMRDVEACHIQALMEFMYAGEVNVAQAHLSGFLKTAESLKIRGLTDTTTNERIIKQQQKGETFKTITTNFNDNNSNNDANKSKLIDNNSNNDTNSLQQQQPITSSHQDITNITAPTTITTTPAPPPPPPPLLTSTIITPTATTKISSPPPKRQCKSDSDLSRLKQIKSIDNTSDNNLMLLNTFNIQQQQHDNHNQIELSNIKAILQPKLELPDYLSDDDNKELGNIYATPADVTELAGGMEIIPQMSTYSSSLKETTQESVQPSADTRKLHSLDPRPCEECGRVYSNLSNLRQHMKLIHYPTIVQCPICKKPFKTDLYLRRHLSSAHDGYYNTNNSNRIMDNPTIRNITPIITTSTTTTPTTAAISTPPTTTAHDYKSFCKNDLKYELRSAT